jgi:drug/metabolite transporter (DMT)-like permease
MQIGPRLRASELLLLLALSAVWGASYSFIKVGVETIPPVTLIAGRTLIAGALLIVVMRLLGIALPRDTSTCRKFTFQACLNSVVPFSLIAWAELTVDASVATVLNSTGPVFTFLLTWGWTRHEATSSLRLFGVSAGLGGVLLIIGVEALEGLGRDLIAQLAIVAATLCYAGAAIFGRSFSGLHPLAPAAGSMLAGAAILVPMSLALERPWLIAPSTRSLLALLGLAVVSTALAFVIYFRLIQTIGSIATTAQAYLRVPIGVAFGIVFLGETPTATLWLGLLCVLVGVAAMTIPARTHR